MGTCKKKNPLGKSSDVFWTVDVLSLSSIKSIIYCLFSILKYILYSSIFYNVWIYPPSYSAIKNNQSALISQVLFLFPESTISL